MARAGTAATRPRLAIDESRPASRQSPRRSALATVPTHDGHGRRPIEMNASDGKDERTSFFAELKRRNVYKVAIAYAVVSWLLIQAASIFLPAFDAPPWVMKIF